MYTVAMIKPKNRLRASDIVGRICSSGLKIVGLKTVTMTVEDVEAFYPEHVGQLYFKPYAEYMTSGESWVLVLEGDNAIEQWRAMIGATDPRKAEKGTIRGDYGLALPNNVVHGSDSVESVVKELEFFFPGEYSGD
jgi:nucleoside-diphosphate kinase